ncbi:hypothetical protein [Brazilian marseillevirus]|uniref:hypothetical protein n=1 Tax=Brazilian marseillevirus TaxID=1813599 RepID=UPI00078650D5|nr:hypothetical protein A3303_gp490 [Brazilian marseillevirus]AMQ10998.1 hypothetical protein [Brazilian marseillevirus]
MNFPSSLLLHPTKSKTFFFFIMSSDSRSFVFGDSNLVGLIAEYLNRRDILSLSQTCTTQRKNFSFALSSFLRYSLVQDVMCWSLISKIPNVHLVVLGETKRDSIPLDEELCLRDLELIVKELTLEQLRRLFDSGVFTVFENSLYCSNEKVEIWQYMLTSSKEGVLLLREFLERKVKFDNTYRSNCDYFQEELVQLFFDLCNNLIK